VDLRQYIRDIPDFPKPGILFRDITPPLREPTGRAQAIRPPAAACDRFEPDLIVGIESRGFIVGTALATHLHKGFVPVRKPGKLPGEVIGIDYTLEYGSDRLEIHADALADHPKVMLVEDLLATGGTASASAELVTKAGGQLVGCGFVIELAELAGRSKLPTDVPIESLIIYD